MSITVLNLDYLSNLELNLDKCYKNTLKDSNELKSVF